MKLKKEVIILGIFIVILLLYLNVNQKDGSNYTVPVLKPIPTGEISKIILNSSDGNILIQKKAGAWGVDDAHYPGDESKIKGVVDVIANLSLTTLISESKSYERYGLDPDHRIHIQGWKDGELVREFEVGKNGADHRLTFVKIAGDPRVYQSNSSFRHKVQGSLDNWRDKSVLSFEIDEIEQIFVSIGEKEAVYTKMEVPKGAVNEGDKEKPGSPEVVWKDATGEIVNKNMVSRLIKEMATLECQSYVDYEQNVVFEKPLATLTFKGDQAFTLEIFEPIDTGKTQYPAKSSQNSYPFFMKEWHGKQVMESMVDIEKVIKKKT